MFIFINNIEYLITVQFLLYGFVLFLRLFINYLGDLLVFNDKFHIHCQ